MIKFIKALIFATSAIILSSCIGEPTRSPYILVSKLAINSDTIKSTSTPVPIGDTLQITMDLQGFSNDLEYFQINMDRDYSKDSIADAEAFLELCNPLYTDAKNGLYAFKPGIKNVHMTLFIMPKRAKENIEEGIPMSLSIKSNCNTGDETNPFSIGFNYYITNKE